MSSSRRLWLLSPIVVLTLFLMALGWRNWHLSNDQDAILLQSANLVIERTKASSYQFICENCAAGSLSQALKRQHPHLKFPPVKTGKIVKGSYMRLFAPEVRNRFYASCNLDYGGQNENDYNSKCLFFNRSPINPFDTSWHLNKVDESPH